MITKSDLRKALKIIETEPKYRHDAYQQWVNGKNCYCVLGAIAKVKKSCGGCMADDLDTQFPSFEKTILRLDNPDAKIDRPEAIRILKKLIKAAKK